MMRGLLLLAPLAAGSAGSVPGTMWAGALTSRPWDLKVHLEDFRRVKLPVPSPQPGEVLLQVAGASINPVEWKLIETPSALAWHYPHVAGFDVSGTVVAVGPGTSRLKVGDKVWGFCPNMGAHAEYVAVSEAAAGLAPTSLPLAQAGVMPLAALTDLQGFRFAGGPWHGRNATVVVLGGSGGTGHFAVQLAKAWGAAKVVTTCGTSNLAFCQGLGADLVIDYHAQEWQKVLEPESVDFVYDAVALQGTGDLAYPVIKDGGYFVTLLTQGLASDAVARQRPSISQTFFLLNQTSTADFDTLKNLVDNGGLAPHIDRTFSLEEIAQVFNSSLSGHTVGKVLVVPSQLQSAPLAFV